MSKLTLNKWYHWPAAGFGSGLMKKAPGTWGSLAALPFCFLLEPLTPFIYVVVMIVAYIFGVYISGKTALDFGVKDHPGIVWDEFVGIWITFFMIPISWPTLLLGFGLFRLFDIWKPWPISLLDRHVGGGTGIMIDDVLAGIFALIGMHLVLPYIPI